MRRSFLRNKREKTKAGLAILATLVVSNLAISSTTLAHPNHEELRPVEPTPVEPAPVDPTPVEPGPVQPVYPIHPGHGMVPVPTPVFGNPLADWVIQSQLGTWCQDQLRVLNGYSMQASMQMAQANFTGAKQALIAGLQAASVATLPGQVGLGPYTYNAIQSGFRMATKMNTIAVQLPNGDKALANFLFAYYDYISQVQSELDLPYFVPNYYCTNNMAPCPTQLFARSYQACGGAQCDASLYVGQTFVGQYESKLSLMAQRQLEVVLNNMAREVSFSQTGYSVHPRGSADLFFVALRIATEDAARYLAWSDFNTVFSCTIQDLLRLSGQLSCYVASKANSGQVHSCGYRSISQNLFTPVSWGTDPMAVQGAYYAARQILNNIALAGAGNGCSFPMQRVRQSIPRRF